MELLGQHDFRLVGSDLRASTVAAPCSRRLQSRLRAFLNEPPLELGEG